MRWRDYETAAGRRPVKEFISDVPIADRAKIVAAMKEIAEDGLRAARHLRGEIHEVRVDGDRVIYRVLFSRETKFILLALEAFQKKTQRTPPAVIELAERRLRDWRDRGQA